jgi:hypothetical protein
LAEELFDTDHPGQALVLEVQCSIMRGTMFRAEIEPMSTNQPDQGEHTGLWKVVIYEGKRFVRTGTERISYREAERIADRLNTEMRVKRSATGA